MNRKRITLVLVLLASMSLSLCFAPTAPIRHAEATDSHLFTPEELEMFDEFYSVVDQPEFKPEIDTLLASWQAGEDVSDTVVMRDGSPSVLIYGSPNLDMSGLENVVDIDWKVNLRAFWIVKAFVPTSLSIDLLLGVDGVATVEADVSKFSLGDDFEKDVSETGSGIVEPDMTEMKKLVKADSSTTYASGYSGDGVVVGLVDDGCDFGHPALQHAYHPDSYDPSGYNLAMTYYHGNTTAVANVTEWLMEGNVLTYEMGGKYYVNTTGWDPVLNNNGGPRHLLGLAPPYGDGYPYGNTVGFIGLYEWAWGINNGSEFVNNEMWMDWEIPDPSNVNGNYSFGWMFQQRREPYAKWFAPLLVVNSTADKEFHLIVDWEGTEAWNAMWNGAFYYEGLDLNTTTDRDLITGLMDWNYTDDFEDETYTLANPVVATDMDANGIDDLSIGALSWTFDPGFFDDEPVFKGFRSDGDAVALFFDHDNHGTMCAGHIAAKDIGETYYQPNNNWTDVVFEGIAPDAKIMAVPSITAGSDIGGYLWCCGFDYNATSQEFYYTGNHQCDVISNSWGWVTRPSAEFNYLGMAWTILSVPDYLNASYPGVLHTFSAGNEGSGFMTIAPPGASTGVLTVGASTSNHWLEYLYGPTQPYEGLAGFSSKGPAFSGYPKPDVLAPGSAGYTTNTWHGVYMQQYWEEGIYWGGFFANTTLFSGTSQASPVVAGVAALVYEAYELNHGDTPDVSTAKAIIQYSADDLGYDPATQGFGRVNADVACSYAEGTAGQYVGMTADSFNNVAEMLDDPWHYWGTVVLDTDVDNTATDFPRDLKDGGLFFGWVYPGDQVTIHYELYDNNGDLVTDTTGLPATAAYEWVEAETFTFDGTTFAYNDTVVETWDDRLMYGYYNITDEIGASYVTALNTYTYVTLAVGFNATEVAGAEPWMFLYDWVDDNSDGMPNHYNETKGEGDELRKLTNANDFSNTNIMPWATTEASIGGELGGDMTLVIHDPIHDVNMSAPGHDFTCTLIFWEQKDTTSMFTFEDDTGAPETYNITLNVPSAGEPGADVGIHQGYVESGRIIPYSYNVIGNLTGDESDVHTIVDGFGGELQPYDNPSYGSMDFEPDDFDFRSYTIYNKHETAGYIGVRAEWEVEGCDMSIEFHGANLTTLGSNTAETATSTAVIADLPADPVGYYYIFIYARSLNGTTYLPLNYTLEVMWYEDLTNKDVILTWSADDMPTDSFADGDTLTGDHVVLNATYPEFDLTNMPEFEVTGMTLSCLRGVYYNEVGSLIIPDSSYNPFDGAPVHQDEFSWEYVEGIENGDTVYVECGFTNGDCDIFAWWYSIDGEIQDNSSWSSNNEILGGDMGTGANPESTTITADFDGDVAVMAVGIFDFDLQAGEYELTVDTRVGLEESSVDSTVTFDTYDLLANGTYQVKVTAGTETNIGYTVNLAAVTFNNFFSPVIENVTVSGTGAEKTVTWDISDQNAGDEHFFEVQLSADSGTTYQLLATNLGDAALSYTWDSTGFLERDTYMIRVTVFDNDPGENPNAADTATYFPGLSNYAESDVFSAGTEEPPTSPTTSETTTTTTDGGFVIDPLWIGLIGGIGVGVVVVLILFLVKRR